MRKGTAPSSLPFLSVFLYGPASVNGIGLIDRIIYQGLDKQRDTKLR